MTGRALELSYNWRTPVTIASIGLVLCVLLLFRTRAAGWLGVAAALIVLWAVFLGVVWARTRARIEVDGARLTVRKIRRTYVLDGRQVVAVKEYLTNSGPSYKVRLSGDDRTYYVPTALLRQGHSTFFDWLLSYAPAAELDKRSRRTIDQLRTRGLIQ
ncbi:hypothetical protein [Microlunatus soli]|uniref:PH domain-containing protein n=1 Tax=Microlunatus soli TaxID=630515 RepID=A0A1H1ULT2_9ACTN|nr:hypothetical protein [Microlunatus soli]SDS73435.1 hypothetical protein SAMN04489812_2844 [Microlunatus soli]